MSDRDKQELAADLRWLRSVWQMATPSVRKRIEKAFKDGQQTGAKNAELKLVP